jgi:TRAP transporter TAXI family solute receptor
MRARRGSGDHAMPFADQGEVTPPRRRSQGKRALVVWAWIVGLCLAALIGTYVLFVEPPPPRKIVIASGGQKGAYFRYAQQYAEQLRKDGLAVEVRETAGSVENLRLLGQDDSGVTIAIVQGGVASPEEIGKFSALGSLYREPLWVFYGGDTRLERVSQLAGKRVGIGPRGSGTHAIAMQLLHVNGVIESKSASGEPQTRLVEEDVAFAAKALRAGELNAAFFVAAFEADYIESLLNDRTLKLLSFEQQEAYHRRYRFLAPVTLPAGIVNLGRNAPDRDVALLAPTAMLVVRKDFHPALVPLVLATATRIHGRGDVISSPGEFPSPAYCDFLVSEDATHYFKSGQPVLQRLLPFWLASLVDRTKVMLIPLVMLLMPLFRTAPPLMRWRTRRKIYVWYRDLRDIDQRLASGLSPSEVEPELARLKDIERHVSDIDVPLSYMEEFYHLRMHIAMLQHVIELRARSESTGVAATP